MTLAAGDHLRIQRNDKLIEPEEEAYHEFVVLGSIRHLSYGDELLNYIQHLSDVDKEGNHYTYHDIRIRVVK